MKKDNEKKIKTQVTLSGNALSLVLTEQKKYEEQDTVRGKSRTINNLLNELFILRNK